MSQNSFRRLYDNHTVFPFSGVNAVCCCSWKINSLYPIINKFDADVWNMVRPMYVRLFYSVSKKIPFEVFWHFFTNGWEFLTNFYTILYARIYDRLQIFIQLFPTLSKLCHIKRNYLVHIICSKCPPSAETHAFRRLRKSSYSLKLWWSLFTPSHPRYAAVHFLALAGWDGLWRWLKFVKCLKHRTPHMGYIVKWVKVWWVWWPLVLCDEVGAIHLQPFLRLTAL